MANTCKARVGKGTGDTICGALCGNRHYCRVHRQQNAARQRRYRANARARVSMVRLSWDVEDVVQRTAALEMAYELRTELADSIADDIADGTEMEGSDG